MGKTEHTVLDFKINIGQYNAIDFSQIPDGQLVITTDKAMPTPLQSDEGKVLVVRNGEFTLETPSSGGVLYRHEVEVSSSSSAVYFTFYTTVDMVIDGIDFLCSALGFDAQGSCVVAGRDYNGAVKFYVNDDETITIQGAAASTTGVVKVLFNVDSFWSVSDYVTEV